MANREEKDKVRACFLQAIDVMINDMMNHAQDIGTYNHEHHLLMINQRNKVAVFLGESKHKYKLTR